MDKKIIFITGCSSGIGLNAAMALHQRGHHVIASCRNKKDLAHLSDRHIETLLLDVNDSNSIHHAFKQLMQMTNHRLDVLINNAGYGQAGALEDIPRDVLRAQFETNVFGLMELSARCIPIMRQQGHGRIINISSVLGIISLPFRGAYNASKYAVEGLSDTLRLELKPSGIEIITIEPGPIESSFRKNAVERSLQQLDLTQSVHQTHYDTMLTSYQQSKSTSVFTKGPEAVIKKLIHAIESPKPKAKYPVTLPTYLFIFLKRIFSTKLLDNLLLYISKKELTPNKESDKRTTNAK